MRIIAYASAALALVSFVIGLCVHKVTYKKIDMVTGAQYEGIYYTFQRSVDLGNAECNERNTVATELYKYMNNIDINVTPEYMYYDVKSSNLFGFGLHPEFTVRYVGGDEITRENYFSYIYNTNSDFRREFNENNNANPGSDTETYNIFHLRHKHDAEGVLWLGGQYDWLKKYIQ